MSPGPNSLSTKERIRQKHIQQNLKWKKAYGNVHSHQKQLSIKSPSPLGQNVDILTNYHPFSIESTIDNKLSLINRRPSMKKKSNPFSPTNYKLAPSQMFKEEQQSDFGKQFFDIRRAQQLKENQVDDL